VLAPTGRLGMFGVSSLAGGKERNVFSMLSMLANTPWFQFNPLRLMNANFSQRHVFEDAGIS
jgi:hypothetical protein